MKLLIIEDDAGLNRGISFVMEQEGYETVKARTIVEGEAAFHRESPDAILLDLNLPDGDGIDFCARVRKKTDVPILMITARDLEVDELMGLKSGADDYITKPFSIAVLKARLENILQRRKSERGETFLVSGNIRLNAKTLRAYCKETELDLSMTEFRLLQYFLENKNQVLLKEQILQHIWDTGGNYVEENTLSVNVSRLRKKLDGTYIRTIPGMGYLWEEQS